MLTAGLGGARRHGCVALSEGAHLVGVCEQERVTRVRGAGFNPSGLPDEALDLLLERAGRRRTEVDRHVVAEGGVNCEPDDRLDHHLAHASAAYLSSPFAAATIVVCDHDAPKMSVWSGRGSLVTRVDWPWEGPGFADLYTQCAAALNLGGAGRDQRLEALARLQPDCRADELAQVLRCDGSSISGEAELVRYIERHMRHGDDRANAGLAAAVQACLADGFVDFLGRVRRRVDDERLCLAGGFFYHSSINSRVKGSGLFSEVFVPVDPGNAGLAVGTALHANSSAPQVVSPFLGPSYSPHEVKETLDNCKLQYSWESEGSTVEIAVEALSRGHLVGWFDGAMEWGPRALGARCILANPFAPFVLENLNRFLKRREAWRGYALTSLESVVAEQFDGPRRAPFMECDYRPADPSRFRHVLPSPEAAIRIQTAGPDAPPRLRRLLEAFGSAAGLPILVNTSFNGFHEPIVCSPRDAVRVFYGSGLDLLIIGQFVLRK
jgi:carbamoyltransferase